MKKDILFKKLQEGINTQDYLILEQFCEIAAAEYPEENQTLLAQIAFANLNWSNEKVLEFTTRLAANNPENVDYQLDLAEAQLKNYQQEPAVILLDSILANNANNEQVVARYIKII